MLYRAIARVRNLLLSHWDLLRDSDKSMIYLFVLLQASQSYKEDCNTSDPLRGPAGLRFSFVPRRTTISWVYMQMKHSKSNAGETKNCTAERCCGSCRALRIAGIIVAADLTMTRESLFVGRMAQKNFVWIVKDLKLARLDHESKNFEYFSSSMKSGMLSVKKHPQVKKWWRYNSFENILEMSWSGNVLNTTVNKKIFEYKWFRNMFIKLDKKNIQEKF